MSGRFSSGQLLSAGLRRTRGVPAALLAVATLGVSAGPAIAADTTPPTVTVTTTPSAPPSGQHGFFNAQDLDANGGHITVNVTASDPSGVTNIVCHEGHEVSYEATVTQSGTNPRTGSFQMANDDGNTSHSCYATDGATPANSGSAPGSQDEASTNLDTSAPQVRTGALARFQRQRGATVHWSGREPGEGFMATSGIAEFDVRYRAAGSASSLFGDFNESHYTAPTRHQDPFHTLERAQDTFFNTDGDTVCFSTQASDAARNLSGFTGERCTALPLDDRALSTSSGWSDLHRRGAYGGTLLRSTKVGSTLCSPVVVGDQLALLATTGPRGGIIRTRWHGHAKTISLRSAHTSNAHVIVLHGYSGSGRLAIRVVGHGVTAIDGLGVWKRP